MRHDFSIDVRRLLAGRAGNKCSVCHKATSGAAPECDVALSDGVAAHISAASPGGPRFDPLLSEADRRSAANGIWVCTQHGREIDAAKSSHTVELLRGLKKVREEHAARELQPLSDDVEQTSSLFELPYVETAYSLFEIINPQSYTFATTSAAGNLLGNAERQAKILALAPDVIVGTWESHPNVVGILCTLLSNNLEQWQPTQHVLRKLEELCVAAIDANDWTRVAAVEPLAFALAGKGRPDIHRRILERLVSEAKWRKADVARVNPQNSRRGRFREKHKRLRMVESGCHTAFSHDGGVYVDKSDDTTECSLS